MSPLRHLARNLCSTAAAQVRPRVTLSTLRALYDARAPITMVTAYDYPTALHVDRAGVDVVLVGDSVGMVCLGLPTTQAVTLDDMIHHTRAARRGTQSSLLLADLPFGTYESCDRHAVDSAIRLIKESGADAVKLEGGISRADTVARIVDAGVAVMGHVGLQPQAVSRIGSFRATGRSAADAIRIVDDAIALESAGAFAIVIECVPARVAAVVTEAVDVPTIGIGSGSSCDGQVLVYHDMLGMMSHPHHQNVAPRFSKIFAEAGHFIDSGLRGYCKEVRERRFPSELHSPYRISDEEFYELETLLAERSINQKHATTASSSKPKSVGTDETIKVY